MIRTVTAWRTGTLLHGLCARWRSSCGTVPGGGERELVMLQHRAGKGDGLAGLRKLAAGNAHVDAGVISPDGTRWRDRVCDAARSPERTWVVMAEV